MERFDIKAYGSFNEKERKALPRKRDKFATLVPEKSGYPIDRGIDAMSWANDYIEKLKNGETVQFRPRGNSMKGKIASGQLVTVAPIGEKQLQKGDIVLCKVNGSQYLHLIKAIQGQRFQIGNNIGRINGWVTGTSIYGVCTGVED